jgi:hypothetical protein
VRHRRRRVRVILQAATLAVLLPHFVAGQASEGLLEVGAARLQHRDIPAAHAVTAGGALRRAAHRYALAAAGGVTLAGDGRSTSQVLLTASLLGRPGRSTRWEIGGALTAFGQGSLGVSGGAYLVAREHFTVGRFGAWVGAAVGGVEDLDHWSPTRTAEIGSWFATRETRLSAAAILVDTRSEPYGIEGSLVTDPVTYADASLGLEWAFRRRIELDARGGLRVISRGALTPTGRGTRPFAAVDAAFWVTPRVAIVAAIGRQLSDLARATPDTRFAALALRFAMRERAASPAPARGQPIAVAAPRLSLVTDTAGQLRLRIAASPASLVELAATFTSWEPVALARRGDLWELDRSIPSGAHRVLVRVDRGPWIVPANLPAAADDFGGTVGIVTVP